MLKHLNIHSCLITEYLPGLYCQGCEAPNLAKVLDSKVGADTIQTSRKGLFCIPKSYTKDAQNKSFDRIENLK